MVEQYGYEASSTTDKQSVYLIKPPADWLTDPSTRPNPATAENTGGPAFCKYPGFVDQDAHALPARLSHPGAGMDSLTKSIPGDWQRRHLSATSQNREVVVKAFLGKPPDKNRLFVVLQRVPVQAQWQNVRLPPCFAALPLCCVAFLGTRIRCQQFYSQKSTGFFSKCPFGLDRPTERATCLPFFPIAYL